MSETPENKPLPRVASYFPLQEGTYDVGPGLQDVGADQGNGTIDQQVFQIDDNFSACHQV